MHSKAQKRVPVPDGLNLDTPFNAAAISKLLALQMPDNLSLATLAFAIALPVTQMEQHIGNEEENRLSKLLSSAFPGEEQFQSMNRGGNGNGNSPHLSGDYDASNTFGKGGLPYFPETSASYPVPASSTGRSAEDNLFYLAPANRALDILPLSQTLADAFEDKKVKRVKGSKKEKRKKTDFDMRDMLPAGAMSSDDEKANHKKEKDRKSGSSRKKEVTPYSYCAELCGQTQYCTILYCTAQYCTALATSNDD